MKTKIKTIVVTAIATMVLTVGVSMYASFSSPECTGAEPGLSACNKAMEELTKGYNDYLKKKDILANPTPPTATQAALATQAKARAEALKAGTGLPTSTALTDAQKNEARFKAIEARLTKLESKVK